MVNDEALDWHTLLLGLAGRAGDRVMTQCRALVAGGQWARASQLLIDELLTDETPLTASDVDFLTARAGSFSDVRTVAARLRLQVPGMGIPLRYGFVDSAPDVTGSQGDADVAAIARVAGIPGAVGLWRSWRIPLSVVSTTPPRPIYVVETHAEADCPSTTAKLQQALLAAGETDPQVEVYPTGMELATYQRVARANGELLWSRTPDRGVRVAVVFDEVDTELGPLFRADHPRVDGAELPNLATYLRAGHPLLVTTALLDDVVQPRLGTAVPTSFRTDGTWVWCDATTYYLEVHRSCPTLNCARIFAHWAMCRPPSMASACTVRWRH